MRVLFKKLFFILVLLAIVVLVVMRSRPAGPAPSTAQQTTRWQLHIAVVDDVSAALVYLAREKGFFRTKDIEVKLERFARGEAALTSLLAGDVDMGTVSDFPLVRHRFAKDDTGVLCALSWSGTAMRVLTRSDVGLRKPKDLESKVVGVPLDSAAHHYLQVFLRYNGMALSAVRLVDMEPDAMPQALLDRKIDALVAGEPALGRARWSLGDSALVFDPPEFHRQFLALAVRKNHQLEPELLRATMGALLQAKRFAESDRDVAMLMVTRQLGEDRLPEVQRSWNDHHLDMSLGMEFFATLDQGARWLLDSDPTLPGAPDFQTLVLDLDGRPAPPSPSPTSAPSTPATSGPLGTPVPPATPAPPAVAPVTVLPVGPIPPGPSPSASTPASSTTPSSPASSRPPSPGPGSVSPAPVSPPSPGPASASPAPASPPPPGPESVSPAPAPLATTSPGPTVPAPASTPASPSPIAPASPSPR